MAETILTTELISMDEQLIEERKDMQALLLSGYAHLKAASYLFLRVNNQPAAQRYLAWLTDRFITNADFNKYDKTEYAVNIAFTASGLHEIGLPHRIIKTFSREFIEGMSYTFKNEEVVVEERQTLLGDTGDSHPGHWQWGNDKNPVDCILLLYSINADRLQLLANNVFYTIQESGFTEVYVGDTLEGVVDKEHFGFTDGISQPYIRHFKMPDGEANQISKNIVMPGEFILGYKNEYNSYSPSPYFDKLLNPADNCSLPVLKNYADKINLGYNGSYLVFRQMLQDVKRFWRYQYMHSREEGKDQNEKAIKLAAKMVGRWPNGDSLVQHPDSPGRLPADQNDFNYANQDIDGTKCPFGAHIRRVNPRDHVHIMKDADTSFEMSNRHRMIRRGRIYGEPLSASFDVLDMIRQSIQGDNDKEEEANRGLHFICLVSDIQRQFEFVQNVWCNTPTFANLTDETDPIISPRRLKDGMLAEKFTVPHSPLRNRYCPVPQFTRIIGGAYFFLPGIRALRFIANYKKDI